MLGILQLGQRAEARSHRQPRRQSAQTPLQTVYAVFLFASRCVSRTKTSQADHAASKTP